MTALTTLISPTSKQQLLASASRDRCLFRAVRQHILCRHTVELFTSLTSSDGLRASCRRYCCLKYLILPPNNLTVLSATKTRASLYWIVPPDTPCILRFELTYDLVDSPFGRYSVTRGIHGDRRQVALVGLIPCQRYRVFMVSIGTTGTTSNFSNEVEFTTTAESLDYRAGVRHTLQIEEVIIIFLIVIVWIIAVSVFIRKWDNIRILEPMEPRYKHAPKNLENVRIVKRAQDSVIYKNYSRKLSFTMDQREKRRLERLNTVPQIGTLPTIQMEEVTEM